MEKTSIGIQAKLEPQSISILGQSSTYARKAKEIRFSITLVSCQKSLRVNSNCKKQLGIQNLSRYHVTVFWAVGLCIVAKSIRDTSGGSWRCP